MGKEYGINTNDHPINGSKVLELHAQLQAFWDEGYGKHGRGWTQETCITLGVLYYIAWGSMPTSRRMNPAYGLVHSRQVSKLFPSFEVYYDAIRAALPPVV